MKKLFIRLLSLMLLISMLAPLILACKDDGDGVTPPDNGDSDDDTTDEEAVQKNEFFDVKLKSSTDYVIVDLSSDAFVSKNTVIQDNLTTVDGKRVLAFNASSELVAELTEIYSLVGASSIRFSVYSEAATGTVVEVGFPYAKKPSGDDASSELITIDFVGWKDFEFIPNKMTGTGMGDKKAEKFKLSAKANMDGSPVTDTLYFTSITVTMPEYELIIPDDVTNINDASLFTCITENARLLEIGTADIQNKAQYKNQLSKVNSNCADKMAKFNDYISTHPTPDTDEASKLFGITVSTAKNQSGEIRIADFYNCVLQLAKGYAMVGSDYYEDENVLEAIKYSLEYGYKFYYGKNAIEYGAYGGWWWWKIGTPQYLIPTLCLIEDELTPALCAKYLECFDHHVPYPEANAANKIWMAKCAILSAALKRDAKALALNVYKMNDIFDYIDDYMDEGGFFEDGSFIQHFYFAYTNGYGSKYIVDLPKLMYTLYGSKFFPQQDNVKNHYDFVINGFAPIMYGTVIFSSLSGREVGQGATEDIRTRAAGMIMMHYYAPDDVKAQLEPLIARYMQNRRDNFSYQGALCMVTYAEQLASRLMSVELEPCSEAKLYGMMARAVQHTPSYGVCLAMSNTNVAKYESISTQNRTGWYQGDGMIFIYTESSASDKGHTYTFDNRFYWYANPLMMPGTTVNSAERLLMGTTNNNLFNASDYAGGAVQDSYMSIGYILDYDTKNTSFSSEAAKDIYAKKSYFFFDNEIICVGSNISDRSGTEVKTVIDNRIWEQGDVLTIGTMAQDSPATVETEITERAIHFTNMGGYVILRTDGSSIKYRKVTGTYNGINESKPSAANGSQDFLELYLVHGVGDTNTGELDANRYYYAYLPSATVQQTAAYQQTPDVVLLSGKGNAHAVLEKTLGIVACNFFDSVETTVSVNDSATAVKSITNETLCSVMIAKGENGEYKISAADPTRTYSRIIFTAEIEGISEIISSDARVSAKINGNFVTVTIDVSGSLGASYELTVL